MNPSPVREVLVLGGGSAGLLAALTLKKKLPQLRVRVVFSKEIGIIGVGEGSLPDLPNHLHGFLGIDPAQFHRVAKPTYKLGVRFLWGPRPAFYYGFGNALGTRLQGLTRPSGFYGWEEFTAMDQPTALMAAGKGFVRQATGAPFLSRAMAYHIENVDFVAALEQAAQALGIEFQEARVAGADLGPEGITAIRLESGEKLTADLYVDCSGFRSELLGRALGEPFIPFDDALYCDRAVAGGWERTDEPVLSFTTAETMPAGWCWQIEHDRHVNRGYVFSSAFASDTEAETEFRARNPKVKQARVVKFRVGRYARSWVGNVVALGNSAGFVEPLEATAIFVICNSARQLTAALQDSEGLPTPSARDAYNKIAGHVWDEIRDFLSIHYRFNTRLDTPFWQHCRTEVALHGAEAIVRNYQENGPTQAYQLALLTPEFSVFGLDGFQTLLMGQKVPHDRIGRVGDLEKVVWGTHRNAFEVAARDGLSMAEGLEIIRSPEWKWTSGFYPG